MKNTGDIPQHKLLDTAGRAVSFEYTEWTGSHIYNTEKAHRHAFHEILLFQSGTAKHDIDFATYTASAGSVHFVASDNVHLLSRHEGSTGLSLLFSYDYFAADVMEQLPFSKARPVLQLTAGQMSRVSALVGEIKTEYTERHANYEKMIRLHMQALALYLARAYAGAQPGGGTASLPPAITTFQALARKHFAEHLTVEAYAGMVHISAKHLIELCRRHTGKTPLQYLREHMIAEAKRLLYNTDLSIKEVAYRLNFDDPASFSRYFKSFTGYTPAAYRKDAGK